LIRIIVISIAFFILYSSLEAQEYRIIETASYKKKVQSYGDQGAGDIYLTGDGSTIILVSYRENVNETFQYQVNNRVYTTVMEPYTRRPVLSARGGGYAIKYDNFSACNVAWNGAGRYCCAWTINPPLVLLGCIFHPADACYGCLVYNVLFIEEIFEEAFDPYDSVSPSNACFVVNGKAHCIDGDMLNLGLVALSENGSSYVISSEDDGCSVVNYNGKEIFRLKGYGLVRELVISSDGSVPGILYEKRDDNGTSTFIRIGEKEYGPYHYAEKLRLSDDGSSFVCSMLEGNCSYFNYNGKVAGPYLSIEQDGIISSNGKGYGFICRDIRDSKGKGVRFYACVNGSMYGPYPEVGNLKLSPDGKRFAFDYSTLYYTGKRNEVKLKEGGTGNLGRIVYVRINSKTFGPYRCINTGKRAIFDPVDDYRGFSVNREITDYAIVYQKDYNFYIKMKDETKGPYYNCTVPQFGAGSSWFFREWHNEFSSGLNYNGSWLHEIRDRRIDKIDLSIEGVPVFKVADSPLWRAGNSPVYIFIGKEKLGLFERADFSVEGSRVNIAYLKENRIHVGYVDIQ